VAQLLRLPRLPARQAQPACHKLLEMQDGLLEALLWPWLSLVYNTRIRAQQLIQQNWADVYKITMYD
jgi:hypothetical protein